MNKKTRDSAIKHPHVQPHYAQLLNISFFIIVHAFLAIGCGGGGGGGGDGGTTVDDTAPTVPANVTAEAISISEIDVTWSVSTDNTSVDGYRIFRNGIALPDTSPDESYSDTGLIDDTQYCYNVTAIDAAGNESAQSSVVCATTLEITGKLSASDASAGDQFGTAVAINSDHIIVGAAAAGSNPTVSGNAYIYYRIDTDTWDEGTKITAGDTDTYNLFGGSVAIYGDYAIVGAQFDSEVGNNAGAAYIFEKSGDDNSWIQMQKIVPQFPDDNDNFGISVAISSDFAVVGATGDDEIDTNSGAIFIYQKMSNTWDFLVKIPVPDIGKSLFGASVAISGKYIIAGGTFTETAYIFQWNDTITEWELTQKLSAPIVTQGDRFGISVAIEGEYAVVGALGTSDSDGAAYIFKRTGTAWDAGAKIIADGVATKANFGKSVSISGDYAIVGADNYDAGEGFTKIGTAYIFERIPPGNTWDSGTQIFALDFEKEAFFGNTVSISNDRAVVGSLNKNEGDSNVGAAYLFDIPPI